MRYLFFLYLLVAINFLSAQSKNKIEDGYDLVEVMHDAYSGGRWYKYFTFIQDIIFFKDGKEVKKEQWYEALSFPGNLIIKFNSMDSNNGVIFSNGKVTGIKDGKAGDSKPYIHDLLLVGFDVYFLMPSESTHRLDSLGYNLKLLREDVFNDRKVFVAGAHKGDLESNQFWIDAERFYLHRIIYKKNGAVQDVVFGDYTLIGNNWVAKSVSFKKDGVLEAEEKYYDIKFPGELSKELFNPEKFMQAKW